MKSKETRSWFMAAVFAGMMAVSCSGGAEEQGILWTKSLPFLYDMNGNFGPVFCGDRIAIVRMERSRDSTKSWLKDRYYLQTLALKTGDEVYETHLERNDVPLQVWSITPWGRKVVVSATYQTGPDFLRQRTGIVVIVDDQGVYGNPILENVPLKNLCVDEKNGLLLYSEKGDFVLVDLESGKEKARHSGAGLEHGLIADGKGDICVAMRSSDWMLYVQHERDCATDVFVQYEVEPWEKKWSATFGPEVGCVGRIAYEGQYLRFTVVRRDLITTNGTSDEKWAAIGIDKHTGKQVELTHPYVPGVRKVQYDGRYYIVSINPDELQVRLSSEIPNVGK